MYLIAEMQTGLFLKKRLGSPFRKRGEDFGPKRAGILGHEATGAGGVSVCWSSEQEKMVVAFRSSLWQPMRFKSIDMSLGILG